MLNRTTSLETETVAVESPFKAVPLHMPLVLDLDGTLLRGDMMLESLALVLKRNPLWIFMCVWWLATGGIARMKAGLAHVAFPDTDLVPANPAVVALAGREAAAGRQVVLATAADELVARRVAQRFPFISRVLASGSGRNLKGGRKAETVSATWPQGFLYAGDSKADLAVWAKARGAVTVNVGSGTAAKVAALGIPVEAIKDPPPSFRTFAKAARLQQGVKNVLIFAPLFLAGRFTDSSAWIAATEAFFGMVLVAAATYLVNDILDLSDDRRHWTKKNRPLASGRLPLRIAFLGIPVLAWAGTMLALAAGLGVLALVGLYTVTTLSYSFWLKRIPVIDTMIIAGLFSLRLLIGVVAIGAMLSPWLFVFSTALFLSIALAKRHTEVLRLRTVAGGHTVGGRGYRASDEPFVLTMGTGAAVASTIFLSLYLMSETVRASFYATPAFLWVVPVAIFLWLGRIWLLSQRGELNDDPVAFAVTDRPSIALGATVAAAFVAASVIHLPL